MGSDKKALLIVNPVAGRKTIQKAIPAIVRIFMDAGYVVTTMVTSEKGEAVSLAGAYGADHDLVVAAGGDGTLNEVVSGMLAKNLRIPIGYIPCGSTNVFAQAQGISSDILSAASSIANGPVREIDVARYGERRFACCATFGAFTWMAYTTDQELKNLLGMGAYVLDSAHDLSKIRPWHVRISVNGVPYEDDYVFGAVSNTHSVAGILQYPKDLVLLDDGRFEVLLIKMPQSLPDWQLLLHSIRSRDYGSCPLIELAQAQNIWVDNPDGLIWSLDGERADEQKTVGITIQQRRLKLKG